LSILPGTIALEFKSLPMIVQSGKATLRSVGIGTLAKITIRSLFPRRGVADFDNTPAAGK